MAKTKKEKIKFNSRIYSLDAIRNAAVVYKEFARFNITKTRGYFIVAIENSGLTQGSELIDEFKNYVLGIL